jgi:hypothetical protein
LRQRAGFVNQMGSFGFEQRIDVDYIVIYR